MELQSNQSSDASATQGWQKVASFPAEAKAAMQKSVSDIMLLCAKGPVFRILDGDSVVAQCEMQYVQGWGSRVPVWR